MLINITQHYKMHNNNISDLFPNEHHICTSAKNKKTAHKQLNPKWNEREKSYFHSH